jgi:hypothetical protein
MLLKEMSPMEREWGGCSGITIGENSEKVRRASESTLAHQCREHHDVRHHRLCPEKVGLSKIGARAVYRIHRECTPAWCRVTGLTVKQVGP